MRSVPRALLAGGLGFAVSCLVACGGGSGLLSGSDSAALNNQLDAVSAAVSNGHCNAAAQALASLGETVNGLPSSVSPTLRTNLLQGVSTVGQLARQECQPSSPAPKPSTPTTTASSSSSTPAPPPTTTQPQSSSSTTPSTSSSTTPATTSTTSGSTSTSGSGGAGLGGGDSGGAGSGGNGNGNGQ